MNDHSSLQDAVPEWIQRLRTFVSAPTPCFLCSRFDEAKTAATWTAPLRHRLGEPAPTENIELLTENDYPHDFVEFFSIHDGATLYEDAVEHSTFDYRTVGIFVGSTEDWSVLTDSLGEWLSANVDDEKIPSCPEWIADAIAFAEVPNSSNYFLLVLEGEYRGRIYYFDHDNFEFIAYADNLEDFFRRATGSPVQALKELGNFAVYSDGKTSVEWIPERYQTSCKDS